MTTLIIVTRAEGDEQEEEKEKVELEDGKVLREGEVWVKKTKKCPVVNAREVFLNELAVAIDFNEREGYGGGGAGGRVGAGRR